jgi:ribose/xylose/arabinose/galactoside ABC-type transport system permease subunit
MPIILFQSSIVGVLALGEMLVMLAGGIDLSIAALAVLAAIIMGGAGSERQQAMSLSAALPYVGFLPAILIAGVSALLIGFIVKLRIATLAMALLLSGLGLLLTGGSPIYYPDPFFKNFGESKFLLLPYPVYVFFLLTIFMMFVLSRAKIGVIVYALGSNYRAARLSGLPVTWTALCVYMISGAFAAVAGFLFLARTAFVAPNSGENLLLTAIASVVVGCVSLAGGKGSIRNAFFGVLLLASLSNLMNILLISPHIQDAGFRSLCGLDECLGLDVFAALFLLQMPWLKPASDNGRSSSTAGGSGVAMRDPGAWKSLPTRANLLAPHRPSEARASWP